MDNVETLFCWSERRRLCGKERGEIEKPALKKKKFIEAY